MSVHRENVEPLLLRAYDSRGAVPADDTVPADDIELVTIDDVDVENKRVLLRADLDVPLTPAARGIPRGVLDDTRIRAALTTIDELRRGGARLVLVSHLGQPDGSDASLSMRPVADRLAELTGVPVPLAPTVIGPRVQELTERLGPAEMLMLENVRFEAGETRNDPRLAQALAELADLYVDDAFAGAHQATASTLGVALRLPAAAGRLMEREVNALSALMHRPGRPLVAILGGETARGRIGLVRRLLQVADVVCLGGGICFPFLAAFGHSVGASLCPREDVERARVALACAAGAGGRLALPKDLVVARWPHDDGPVTLTVDGVDIPDGWMGLDIGPKTARWYAAEVLVAETVFWSGPMGRFELPQFAAGTRAIADAIASTSAATVAQGGETLQVLSRFGLQDRISHVSAGGPATLEFLEGHELPGVQVLQKNPRAAPRDMRSRRGRSPATSSGVKRSSRKGHTPSGRRP
jgi:phosphoglycerate kinase